MKFTIQNVSIKFEVGADWDYSRTTFTIQNVSIKCRVTIDNAIVITDLQYKMFLLNWKIEKFETILFKIYNTKCFY